MNENKLPQPENGHQKRINNNQNFFKRSHLLIWERETGLYADNKREQELGVEGKAGSHWAGSLTWPIPEIRTWAEGGPQSQPNFLKDKEQS